MTGILELCSSTPLECGSGYSQEQNVLESGRTAHTQESSAVICSQEKGLHPQHTVITPLLLQAYKSRVGQQCSKLMHFMFLSGRQCFLGMFRSYLCTVYRILSLDFIVRAVSIKPGPWHSWGLANAWPQVPWWFVLLLSLHGAMCFYCLVFNTRVKHRVPPWSIMFLMGKTLGF